MTNIWRYWPGGIPDRIIFHPHPILGPVKEEVKGWQLFLEEGAVAQSSQEQDALLKTQQRRQLMQQWASLSQNERDAYYRRASVVRKESWYPSHLRSSRPSETIRMVNCIVPWPMSPRNRALWTKLRIMLYCLDGDDGTLFGEEDGEVSVPEPNPAGPNPLTPQDFLRWCYVEQTDFDHIAMTVEGTVICHNWQSTALFADQQALETGLMLLCHIENNGQVICSGRVWPVLMKDAYVSMISLGKPVQAILDQDMFKAAEESRRFVPVCIDDHSVWSADCRRVNMDDPIIKILESRAAYLHNADTSLWEEAIERCAPGYLEMEEVGGGMTMNYDHANFRSHENLEKLPWNDV